MAEPTTQPAPGWAGLPRRRVLPRGRAQRRLDGSRLAIGALSFLFGAFAFAYFYLRSVNSSNRWQGSGLQARHRSRWASPSWSVLVSAIVQYAGLQRIKAGDKSVWQISALLALIFGVAAVVVQIIELLNLPFQPGSSGFSSVFTGTYPLLLVSWFAAMVWLEILIMRARPLPAISFVEQPPTYAEAFAVQRFQSTLSAFTLIWNYLAVVTLFFFLLFYVL